MHPITQHNQQILYFIWTGPGLSPSLPILRRFQLVLGGYQHTNPAMCRTLASSMDLVQAQLRFKPWSKLFS